MNKELALQKENYILIASGMALVVLGFILMAGGGSEDPNVFSREIFSTQRLTVAPTLALIGYAVVMVGIMKKPKNQA